MRRTPKPKKPTNSTDTENQDGEVKNNPDIDLDYLKNFDPSKMNLDDEQLKDMKKKMDDLKQKLEDLKKQNPEFEEQLKKSQQE